MSRDETPPERDASAAALAWWVKADAGLSSAERAALEAWLSADPSHRAAFDEAELLFGEVRRLWSGRRAAAPRRLGVTAAAALLAASLVVSFFADDAMVRLRSDAMTRAGETRRIALEDGSVVHLAGKSAFAIRYSAGERRLALLAGEAYFEAAPDTTRPFVVEAAGATVTALGTAFDVALEDGEHAAVAVAEHSVAVANDDSRTIVEEGRLSRFGVGSPTSVPTPVDLFRVGGWRRGRLVFEDEPLGNVLATLGRYRNGVIVAAPSTRGLRVTGSFDAGNPAGALRALEASLGLTSVSVGNYMIYLYK